MPNFSSFTSRPTRTEAIIETYGFSFTVLMILSNKFAP